MWLQILQSCKHERDAFFAGETRYVSGACADVLIAMGWARAEAAPFEAARVGALEPASVTLQIHSSALGVADTLKGT